ncbi:MAG: calcineurin-like phosphoesterase family protein [Armatimonadetes bacterium]|nr:calcineurin-like phosphoesterase family protein [Armatimonadota bacterium]
MNRRQFLFRAGSAAAGLSLSSFVRPRALDWTRLPVDGQGRRYAEGVVFNDKNGNGRRDGSEPGIPGVCVSNGRDVVKTDASGKWRLPVDGDCVLFVIKPSGWKVPLGDSSLPRFYHVHRPDGSPDTKYDGLLPTGALPASVDFGLTPQREGRKFKMVLFGDPQPRNQTEIDYMTHDVIEQVALDVVRSGASFGLSLGDEMFDDLSLYDSLNRVIGSVGIPWYNTVGNHDLNYDSADNVKSTETFTRVYGPTHYAFNHGPVHFIVLNDVVWHGAKVGGYHGELTVEQLEFVKNDLAHVAKERLVVVAMHIPLTEVRNRRDLYRLLEDRPNTLSFSAHTHVQRHDFIGKEDGWNGKAPHHHLNHATVCGSWWEGAFDERGIPHATMSDGAPNGYSLVEFDDRSYKVTFRPASRPETEQMAVWIPDRIEQAKLSEAGVVVNVFAGSERSKVECRVGDGPWKDMTNFTGKCPFFLKLKESEAGPKPPNGLKLPGASDTPHLWKTGLPAGLAKGAHRFEVRTTDMFGQTYTDYRILTVL